MSETVYIETSILSYLTARSTKNLLLASQYEDHERLESHLAAIGLDCGYVLPVIFTPNELLGT